VSFLIGAYGQFWRRHEVDWKPGRGRSWQILGKRGALGSTQICDFRRAHGFYILHNEHRANYVGLARGAQGIGQRLQEHDQLRNTRVANWSRFSWFSLDALSSVVGKDDAERWLEIKHRPNLGGLSTRSAIGEFRGAAHPSSRHP